MNERLIAPSGSGDGRTVCFKVFPRGQKQVPGCQKNTGINAYEGAMEVFLFAVSDLLRATDSLLR